LTVPWQQPAEKRQADDLFGSESLWIPAGGAAREEKKRRRRRKKSEVERIFSIQGQPQWW